MRTAVVVGGLVMAATLGPAAQTPNKVDIVSVSGCLREQDGGRWVVTAATDPVVSDANAPPKSEIPTTPPDGKNTFHLIGVSEFNLPSLRDQTVVVKGLFIKAQPMSRINVTSVVRAVSTCATSSGG